MKKILMLLMIIPVLFLISSKNITVNSKDYLRRNLVDQTTKSGISSALESIKSSLSGVPLYNTNKFNCTVSGSNVSCSTSSYQKVGLFSYPEYTLIGGKDSYLYTNNPYFVLNNGSVSNLMSNDLATNDTSGLRPAVYLSSTSTKGSGTKNNPYVLTDTICFVSPGATTCRETNGATTVGTIPDIEREGYTFVGWYSQTEGGFEVTENTPISNLIDRKVYARWQTNTYTITYDLQNGTLSNLPTEASYDETLTINNPTKSVTFIPNENNTGATIGSSTTNAQTFKGWDISGMDNAKHIYGDNSSTAETISLSKATTYKNLRATSGEVAFQARWTSVATNLPVATKTGYTCGWAKSASYPYIQTITVPETQGETMELYAVCKPSSYAITLDNQGATTAGTTTVYQKYTECYSLTSSGSAATKITVPTKTGYHFAGYYTGTNGSGTQIINASGTIVGSNTQFTAPATIYAYWSTGYLVSVNCTNCTSEPSALPVNSGSSAVFEIIPTPGYTISGATVSGTGCSLSGNTLTATNVTSDRTCTVKVNNILYLVDAIMSQNTVSTRTSFDMPFKDNTAGTIFSTNRTDDNSTVYYYAGSITNNWVIFGNDGYYYYYWRIIRTNSSEEGGGVRLLYSGRSSASINTIATTATSGAAISSKYNDEIGSVSLGYMYTEGEQHGHNLSSIIKTKVESWYESSKLSDFESYINTDAVYCNDRSVPTGTTWVASPSSQMDYAPHMRLYSNKYPTYKCGGDISGGYYESASNRLQDRFSKTTNGGGNGYLTHPIGLMTADEASFAGAVYNRYTESPYVWIFLNGGNKKFNVSSNIWFSSPYYATATYSYPMMGASGNSHIYVGNVTSSYGVRPVISLKSNVRILEGGNGTPEHPYIVVYNE